MRGVTSRRAMLGALGMLGAAGWLAPLARALAPPDVPAQGVRRVGVLMGLLAEDPKAQRRAVGLELALRDLGWIEGNNLRIDYRFTGDDAAETRQRARELIALQPDVIFVHTRHAAQALRQEQSGIPIVFALVSDPVADGLVANLAHPGGSMTGFAGADFPMAGKWLETLRAVRRGVTEVALLGNPDAGPYRGFWEALEAAAKNAEVRPIRAQTRSDAEIEAALADLAGHEDAGFIVLPDGFTMNHRDKIIAAAARHRLPAVYPGRAFVESGGLVSDGIDGADVFRRSAAYVDRILRGAKPADLPVLQPTKFELVINLKTARSLGLALPPPLLAIADALVD